MLQNVCIVAWPTLALLPLALCNSFVTCKNSQTTVCWFHCYKQNTHNRLKALGLGLPGWAGTKKKTFTHSTHPDHHILNQYKLPRSASFCTFYLQQCKREACSIFTNTRPFNGPFSGTTQASRYQKDKTNLDFTEARDSEWHQLGHMQVCILLQTDNHPSTSPLFLQAGCPSCRPTNSVKASQNAIKMIILFRTYRDQ